VYFPRDSIKYAVHHSHNGESNAYENGKRAITADILKNICLILKVSSDELLEINIKKPYNDLNDENSLILEKIKRGLLTIQKSEKNA